MREAIKEFLTYSDAEKREIWDTATFVFDTNVLLNLYRMSSKTRIELKKAMSSVSDRAWLPYHVAWEYAKDRHEVIYECCNRYKKIEEAIGAFSKTCREQLRIHEDDKGIKAQEKQLRAWAESHKKKNPPIVDSQKDEVLDYLLGLFDGKTGTPYSEEEKNELVKEGKERYDKKMPPGYKDASKSKEGDDNNQYGDYIIWQEIMDHAKEQKTPVVFVTGDQKEDWWHIVHGEKKGPRTELKREFADKTGQKIMFYSTKTFIEHCIGGNKLEAKMSEELKGLSNDPLPGDSPYDLDEEECCRIWKDRLIKSNLNREKIYENKENISFLNQKLTELQHELLTSTTSLSEHKSVLKSINKAQFDLEMAKKRLAELETLELESEFFKHIKTDF